MTFSLPFSVTSAKTSYRKESKIKCADNKIHQSCVDEFEYLTPVCTDYVVKDNNVGSRNNLTSKAINLHHDVKCHGCELMSHKPSSR